MFKHWKPKQYEYMWLIIGNSIRIVLSCLFFVTLYAVLASLVLPEPLLTSGINNLFVLVSGIITGLLFLGMIKWNLMDHPVIYWWVVLKNCRFDYERLESQVIRMKTELDNEDDNYSYSRSGRPTSVKRKEILCEYLDTYPVGLYYIKSESFKMNGKSYSASIFFANPKAALALKLTLDSLVKPEEEYD